MAHVSLTAALFARSAGVEAGEHTAAVPSATGRKCR
jgi:hypothetical protein